MQEAGGRSTAAASPSLPDAQAESLEGCSGICNTLNAMGLPSLFAVPSLARLPER